MKRLKLAAWLLVALVSCAAVTVRADEAAVKPATRPATEPSGLSMTGPAAAVTKYISVADFDFKALLGNPPADDSAEHKAEVDKLLSLQADRTPAQEKRFQDEEEVTVFAFADVLGPSFDEKKLPLTAKLMKDVYADGRIVSNAGKALWGRVRPPVSEPRIKACVKLEKSASYPSGHATRGIVWATLLAEVFPDKSEGLMARGREIGTNRSLAGMHWPSDVVAGQKLGTEIVRKLNASEKFKADFAKAREEMLAVVGR